MGSDESCCVNAADVDCSDDNSVFNVAYCCVSEAVNAAICLSRSLVSWVRAFSLLTRVLLRESIDLSMDAVPGGVAHDKVQDYLASVPGVLEVHDLHIWGLSTTQTALTAHLVCADPSDENRLRDVTAELRDRFGIGHATLQIETDAEAELCRLRPHDVV